MTSFDFHFAVRTVEEAILARAACDGIIKAATQQKFQVLSMQTAVQKADALAIMFGDSEKVANDDPQEPAPEAAAAPPATQEAPETEDNDGYSKAQIKEAAAHLPELAALVSKRGKKPAEMKARIQELTASYYQSDSKSPAAITETLQEETPPPAPQAEPMPAEPALTKMSAAELHEVMKGPQNGSNGLAALDPDLGSISAAHVLSKPEPELEATPSPISLATLSQQELANRIVDLADANYGYGWFSNVIKLGGGKVGAMPSDYMRQVLTNPDAYYPAS